MLDSKELKELLTVDDLLKVELEQDRIAESLDLYTKKEIIECIDGFLIVLGPDCLSSLKLYYCKRNSELFDYLKYK